MGEHFQVSCGLAIISYLSRDDSYNIIRYDYLFRSRYDLYTKSTTVPDIDELWPYYQSLIDKYLPGKLEF